MKSLPLVVLLALSGLTASCTTIHPEHSAVNAAWLDTTPRKAEHPPRQADGITHWTTGLPPARTQPENPPNYSSPALVTSTTSSQADEPPQDLHREPLSYVIHHRTNDRGRGHRSRCNPPRAQRQPFERTVEKVGPSIVPRPTAPLIDRTLGASGPLNHGLSQRSRAHR